MSEKLSEQVRKMVGEWHKGPQSESFATPRHVMAMCADALETLLPQIEALEKREDELIRDCNDAWIQEVGAYLHVHGFDLDIILIGVRERLSRKEQVK